MKVLIVRAAEEARRTAARLEAAGHQAIIAPVLDIRALDFEPPEGSFDAVLATSAHAFGRRERIAALCGLPIYVVGARTSEAAQKAGFFQSKIIAANAEELARAVRDRLPSSARLIYLAGRDRKPDIETSLAGACTLTVVETYEARAVAALPPAAVAALASGEVDAVLHYSQRSAAIFLELARRAGFGHRLGTLRHVTISADAAKPLAESHLPAAVAAQPGEDSMIEELARLGRANEAGDA